MLTPVIILNSSPATWIEVPMPADAMLSLPGVAPISDIKDLSSHTHDKATSGHKEQFRTVTHRQGAQSRFLPEYLKHGAPHGHRCSVICRACAPASQEFTTKASSCQNAKPRWRDG